MGVAGVLRVRGEGTGALCVAVCGGVGGGDGSG